MDYKEALKKVQARKPKGNFILFEIGYDNKLILPHADGIVFMNTLANAEQFNDPYNAKHSISELKREKIKVSTMSQDEYERYKIAALLNITVEEVIAAQQQND